MSAYISLIIRLVKAFPIKLGWGCEAWQQVWFQE